MTAGVRQRVHGRVLAVRAWQLWALPRWGRTVTPVLSPSVACAQRAGTSVAISALASSTLRAGAKRPTIERIVQSPSAKTSQYLYPTRSIIVGM